MSVWQRRASQEIVNMAWLAVLALVESLQVLIVLVWVFSFIPIHVSPFVNELWPLNQRTIVPERELFFFQVFVAMNIGFMALALFLSRRHIKEVVLGVWVKRFLRMEAFWLLVQLFAVFHRIVHQDPLWAVVLFYGSAVLSWLMKFLWPEISERIWQRT